MSRIMGGNVSFDPSNMVITAGGTPAVEVLAFCLADHGNAFLIPSPYYPGYYSFTDSFDSLSICANLLKENKKNLQL